MRARDRLRGLCGEPADRRWAHTEPAFIGGRLAGPVALSWLDRHQRGLAPIENEDEARRERVRELHREDRLEGRTPAWADSGGIVDGSGRPIGGPTPR